MPDVGTARLQERRIDVATHRNGPIAAVLVDADGTMAVDAVEVRDRLTAIETKLDALILALKAGAIGRWQA